MLMIEARNHTSWIEHGSFRLEDVELLDYNRKIRFMLI